MPAPLVAGIAKKAAAAAAKKAAAKAAAKAKQKHAGKGVAAVAVLAAASLFLICAVVMGFASIFGGVSGGIAAATMDCNTTQTAVDTTTPGTPVAGIPAVAFDAYTKAAQTSGIDWVYIAAIGRVESTHGAAGGGLDANGNPKHPIYGPVTSYGRAEGPMQFLHSTWFGGAGKDGNFDRKKDPQNIYDAALATGFYLKNAGAPGDMRKAIWSYNHSSAYIADVLGWAAQYRKAAANGVAKGGGGNSQAAVAATVLGPDGPDPVRLTTAAYSTGKQAAGSTTAPGWVLPEKAGSYTLTARWGEKGDMWSKGYHTGLDFAGPIGNKVYAAADGVVQRMTDPGNVKWAGPNFVIIHHGTIDGKTVDTWYAHMQALAPGIRTGTHVTAGQWIGNEGAEGNVTGPHLHFEVHVDGPDVDPEIWLKTAGSPDPSGLGGCGSADYAGTGPGPWGGYENGKIPLSAMCKLSFYDTYLRCDAAAAMEKLNTAYQGVFGRTVGPVGGYRPYADQVACRAEKGNLCAVPGTSNHGWGMAADLDGGGINIATSQQHKWMLKHAPDYGWVLPDWARPNGSKPEPWHWEFNGGTGSADTGSTVTGSLLATPTKHGSTSFTLGDWNMLGAGHTDGPRANKPNFPSYTVRMDRAVAKIRAHGIDVLGMQEFQGPQQARFRALMPGWAMWGNTDNYVAWNAAKFHLVATSTYTIPYFHGQNRQMPIVRLRANNGVEFIVISTHNPADARGPAQQYRDMSVAIEGSLTRTIAGAGVPVYLTGDMNDKQKFFCPMSSFGVMAASSGGSNNGVCRPPAVIGVDWILGSKYTTGFHGHVLDRNVDAASDHPIVVTQTTATN